MSEDVNAIMDTELILEEVSGKIGSWPVLGKIVGPHFVPNGRSRNGRFYEKELWEKALNDPNVQQMMTRKLMFGTVGHAKDWDTEKFIREGLVSHVTTTMYIDPNTGLGMCEDYIIDTLAGRSLFACMKAGSKFFVSSRAYGDFKNETKEGLKVVDPNKFKLEGFDIVINPGFLEASPALMESMKNLGIDSNVDFEEVKEVVDEVVDEVVEDEKKVDEKSEPVEDNQGGDIMTEQTISILAKEKEALEKSLQESLDENKGLKEKLVGHDPELTESYKKLGTPDEINKALNMAETMIFKYQGIGTPEEINEQLDNATAVIKAYHELGTIPEISEALDKGKVLLNRIREYCSLGTPEEISEALDKAIVLATDLRDKKISESAADLSTNYSIPIEAVKSMLEKMTVTEVENTLKKMNEGDQYDKDDKDDKDNKDDDKDDKEDDSDADDSDGADKDEKKGKKKKNEDGINVFEELLRTK